MLFTKLICKLEKDQIEQWVSKDYFPADKCLMVCKECNNLRGQAILTKRIGNPVKAIGHYLEILAQ